MNKKEFFILGFLFLVANSVAVSAQYGALGYQITNAVQSTINAATSIGQPVFSALIGDYNTSSFLFTKFLLALLLFVVIDVVIKNAPMFRGHKGVAVIVSLVISLFAIRFMSENDLINGILLPYGTLGVAIVTILPFFVFFYFVHKTEMTAVGRRLCWIFFGITFLVIWGSRTVYISPTLDTIYLITFIGIIIALIFDRGLHGYFGMFEGNRENRMMYTNRIAQKEAEIARLISSGVDLNQPDVKRAITSLREQIKELKRHRGYF